MNKKLLVSILLFIFIFFLGILAKETDTEQKQTDVDKTKIVEEWQTDPDAFARLFFGDDLSWELAKKRKPGGAFCSDEVTKAILGAQVEWHGLVGNASSNAWAQLYGSPLEIRVLFGPEKKYLIHITGSRREGEKEVDWKEMVKNIKPGTKVRVKLKISRKPVAAIAKNRIYFIMLDGEALEIYPIN